MHCYNHDYRYHNAVPLETLPVSSCSISRNTFIIVMLCQYEHWKHHPVTSQVRSCKHDHSRRYKFHHTLPLDLFSFVLFKGTLQGVPGGADKPEAPGPSGAVQPCRAGVGAPAVEASYPTSTPAGAHGWVPAEAQTGESLHRA